MTEIERLRAENEKLRREIMRLNQPYIHEGKGLAGFEGIMPDRDSACAEQGANILALIQDAGPIFSRQIERRLDISGTVVRSVVGQHRCEGQWICATSKGYFWGDREDVKKEIHSLQQRARAIWRCAKGLEGGLTKGQLELEFLR